MSSVFPLRGEVDRDAGEPRLLELEEEAADEVFEALSSGTTRHILSALHEQPRTASDLADLTDTSVQNAQYHIGKLRDAELIEAVDTWYSERGREMTVYAPTDEALVLFAGGDQRATLRSLLSRVVGAVGLLGFISALVYLVTDRLLPAPAPAPAVGPAGSERVGPSITTDGEAAEAATSADAAAGLDPALLAALACLIGGLLVLCALGAVWYWTVRTERMARRAGT